MQIGKFGAIFKLPWLDAGKWIQLQNTEMLFVNVTMENLLQ